jgi:hypothetical protein
MTIPVSEHFRHRPGVGATHPQRSFTWQRGNIMERLLANFDSSDIFDVETDRRYTTAGLDFVVDMLVKERTSSGQIETAVLVESAGFNANEFLAQWRYLTVLDTHLMLILSAHGDTNPGGKYFRPDYRDFTGKTVVSIPGNEKAVYDKQGRNVYFDHDDQRLKILRFDEYTEYHPEPQELPNGHVIPAGLRTFRTKKTPVVVHSVDTENVNFGLRYKQTNRGLLIARPVSFTNMHYMFELEEKAEDLGLEEMKENIGERIGIALDSMGDDRLRELSETYGKEKLGAYFISDA